MSNDHYVGAQIRRRVLIVLVNAAVFAACLLVIEAVFGSWTRPNSMARLSVPRGLRTSVRVANLYRADRSHVTYSRDEFGLRGAFPTPSEIDVLTLGGSTTDQRYVDDEDTWQAVMQGEFARNGKRVHIANAGVDSQSSFLRPSN